MCADIYTKAFTDVNKWNEVRDLIGVFDTKTLQDLQLLDTTQLPEAQPKITNPTTIPTRNLPRQVRQQQKNYKEKKRLRQRPDDKKHGRLHQTWTHRRSYQEMPLRKANVTFLRRCHRIKQHNHNAQVTTTICVNKRNTSTYTIEQDHDQSPQNHVDHGNQDHQRRNRGKCHLKHRPNDNHTWNTTTRFRPQSKRSI